MGRHERLSKRFTAISFALLLIMISLLMSGCLGKILKKPAKKDPPPPKIGILMATMQGDGYQVIKKEMEKAKQKEKVELVWQDAKNDPRTQQEQVEKLTKEKVKVIVLDMVNPSLGGGLVPKIAEQKIPVLALDKIPVGTEVAGVVLPDYLRAGELQGRFIGKAVSRTSGKVLVLMGQEDSQLSKALYEGFSQGLAAEVGIKPGVVIKKVVISDLVTDKEVGPKVKKTLQENTDAVAVVSQEPRQTLELINFLTASENKAQAEKWITVGFGADKTASVAVAAGLHEAEVDTRPDLLAYYTLMGAKQLASGQKLDFDRNLKNDNVDVPARVIPVRLITLENTWLLQDRWGDLKKEVKKLEKQQKGGKSGAGGQGKSEGGKSQGGSSDQGKSGEGSGGGSGQESGKQGSASKEKGKKTTVTIKTKTGKTMKIEVDGEIEEIQTR